MIQEHWKVMITGSKTRQNVRESSTVAGMLNSIVECSALSFRCRFAWLTGSLRLMLRQYIFNTSSQLRGVTERLTNRSDTRPYFYGRLYCKR